jgi:hypothetical protein
VIQCQICQVANEDIAQFCKECGGRLSPTKPLITNSSPVEQAAPVQQAPAAATPVETQAQPRPKLRSPLFGGSEADNNFDDDEEVQPVLNKPKGRGLRSPLLGGADEDEEPAFEPKPRDAKSRGLRSPILGGGADGGKNKEHKSTFPHRSHEIEDQEPSPTAKLEPGRHQSKGLRSPLLGGDDFDPEAGLAEEPGMSSKAAGQVKAHHRLRSPIFGATDDDYEDEIFDEEVDDVDDPNVLRSPLLAVKTPRAKTPAPAPAAQAAAPIHSIPAPAPAPAPVQAPAPLQQYPAQQAPTPLAPYPAANQAFAQNSPSSPPAAPTSAPRYEPKPAPSPSNSQFGMAAQNPHYDYGVQPTAMNVQAPQPAPLPGAMSMPAPQPAPSSPPVSDSDSAVKKGLRGSKLLSSGGIDSDDEDDLLGPRDRRSKSRERRMSRPDRRNSSSIDIDDDNDDVLAPSLRRTSSGAGGAANPMAPLLMAAAAFALIIKAYVFVPLLGNPDLFTKNMPYVLEQVSTMAVLLSLIMYAMKASQKP